MTTRNIVPRADGEGNIGTSLKNWFKGWFKDLFVSGDIVDGTSGVAVNVADLDDAVDKKHLQTKLGTKFIDETDIGNNKIIQYEVSGDKLKYINLPGGGDMLKSVYDTDENEIVDKAESLDDGAGNTASASDTKDAVTKKHEHSNKTELDLVTDGDHDVRIDNPHGVSEATKEVFFQADYGSNEGNFRTRAVGSTANFNFNFKVPHDFSSIDSLVICGIIVGAGAIGSGRDIDLFSEYGGANEAYNNHAESDTTSLFDFSSNVQFDIIQIDISSVFTNLSAGDYCGINVDHNGIGGTIEYLGICLKYN